MAKTVGNEPRGGDSSVLSVNLGGEGQGCSGLERMSRGSRISSGEEDIPGFGFFPQPPGTQNLVRL